MMFNLEVPLLDYEEKNYVYHEMPLQNKVQNGYQQQQQPIFGNKRKCVFLRSVDDYYSIINILFGFSYLSIEFTISSATLSVVSTSTSSSPSAILGGGVSGANGKPYLERERVIESCDRRRI
eukprot:m.236796 g.236796  ORF g.236796 m.236796 type:complete len:122 (-) comp16054_c0_seq7:2553-2918(-)